MDEKKERLVNGGPIVEIANQVSKKTTCVERVIAFAAIPITLLLISVLPPQMKSSMVLHLESPTIWQAYLTNFIHAGFHHLMNNVVSYLFIMMVLLPLSVLADWKRELLYASLFFLIGVPFLVSYYSISTLAETPVETVVGFSGVGAAFLGFIPVALFAYLHNEVSQTIRLNQSLCLVALELALVLYSWSSLSVSSVLLFVLGTLGVGLLYWQTRGEWSTVLEDNAKIFLVVVTVLVFFSVPFQILVDVDAGTNVYGHFIGFVAGFLFPALLSLTMELRAGLQDAKLDSHFVF